MNLLNSLIKKKKLKFPSISCYNANSNQKHMTSRRVTCNSFSWNKDGDFKNYLYAKYGKNMIKAARAKKILELRYTQLQNLKEPEL